MAIWKGMVKDVIRLRDHTFIKIDDSCCLMHGKEGTGSGTQYQYCKGSKKLFQWFEGCPEKTRFYHRTLEWIIRVVCVKAAIWWDDGHGNWWYVAAACIKAM